MSHSPRLAAATPPRLPTASTRAEKPRSASAPDHHIERDVVAAHDDEVGRARGAADQRDLRRAAGIERGGQRVDLDEAVGLREAGHRAGALAGRERDRAVARPRPATTSTNSLRPSSEAMRTGTSRRRRSRAASGGRPARARITGATKAWKVKIAEVGKPGSTTIGLSPTTREAQRLAGLERDAMHQNAGRAEPRHDRVRQIAGAFRGAAGQHDHVACARARRARPFPAPPRRRERRRTRTGSPPASRHRGGDDRAVAVVDAGRRQRLARRAPVRRRSRAPRPSAAAPRRPRASPQAASMPISREPMRAPRRSNVSPRAMSEPA